ncbi:MAG: hypothetical protein K2K74_16700, partial [Lachnospiraceae bacterium]|nr:hypothetical protein [Lachnospiraceae bacterium]
LNTALSPQPMIPYDNDKGFWQTRNASATYTAIGQTRNASTTATSAAQISQEKLSTHLLWQFRWQFFRLNRRCSYCACNYIFLFFITLFNNSFGAFLWFLHPCQHEKPRKTELRIAL